MGYQRSGQYFSAVLFDLDGVLTATARLHEAAWKETFDAYLQERSSRTGETYAPFAPADYAAHLDGRLREDGVREFLRSRGISLPEGTSESPPDEETVWGLGNRKNQRIEALIGPGTVEVFPGSLEVVRAVRDRGQKTAVVSASANCRAVLRAAGITHLFDTIVDGKVAAELGLRGKPEPDTFLEAARRLGVPPEKAIVVEDAVAGVRAGRAGRFGLVIGVDRRGQLSALRRGGADIVVADPWVLLPLFAPARRGPKFHRLVETYENVSRMAGIVTVDPWKLTLNEPAPQCTAQFESMLALSNGYFGIRGSVEEGAPSFRPATLLNGFYESWPIAYAEEAYGFARTGQTIVAVPDAIRIRLFADDVHFDPVRDDLEHYERTLHLDRGVLERVVVWRLPGRSRIAVRSKRIVSLASRHLACIVYEVEALDRPVSVVLSSELTEQGHQEARDEATDPRVRRADTSLLAVDRKLTDDGAMLAYTTKRSGRAMACGMAHVVRTGESKMSVQEDTDVVRAVFKGQLVPGQPLRVEKFVTYHQSGTRFAGELMFRVQQTLETARELGADAIFAEHEAVVREFWRDADVEVEGAPGLQCALRFNLFHLLQATCLAEGHGVPAKGLTGEGYEGHYFWDIEMYVVPFLVYTRPLLARSLLLHRYHQLPLARQRAREVGQKGALYPWRTISGEDASAFYAAGTAQYHINADIAFAVRKYVQMTGDREFLVRYGAEMLVETARLWVDLGFFSERKGGRFVINGVTGPDEYTTVVDNNAFTNLMARENLRTAAAVVEDLERNSRDHYDRLVSATNLSPAEPGLWRRAADAMYVPYDAKARVHLQDEAFLDLKPWDFDGTPPEKYPLLLHFHPLFIYRHQVIKQPDMLLAAFLLGHEFSDDEKRRMFEYYDPITTGDSSLSECIQAIVACEVGEVGAAHRYLVDSAVVDLADRNLNVRDGVHLASCAGTWMAMVHGFAGMRDADGELSFRPIMPPHWQKLRFRVRVRGSLLEVELRQGAATYRLVEGPALAARHGEESFVLEPGTERVFTTPIARTSVLPQEAYEVARA